MFGGGENFVEIDGDIEGDEEEVVGMGVDLVWGSEGRRSNELGLEGGGVVCREDGRVFGGREVGEGEVFGRE